ncbi:UDP-N-acetylmuramoylalanyl-D-glutamate--2,6-diaminopimelate ligase [Cetobacterium ceti]|uniref:UDP-N-acetylmuramoyl-L-alanyl-D-glutamate--2,6-diaminopimelate ligase n=1 Tax=Cetobacterium ceti TaxID=180163 RepID=A0A1T4NU20_9FUSO|nr:UDP-N-acetylmuramoyl-L-alanyl-D-glutamate--2,6-diaminopimelate ligase [Cetobacterium ceti]SJZ82741.1 UDP-N-acetylmuramoylalanyl-D-glutamate--2,6-diaminopimelate ligase [Cetobacterium ceti]
MDKIFCGVEVQPLQISKEIKYGEIEYDSRKIKEGDLFAALEGAVVDGHDYIDTAIEKGAKGIIVSKKVPMREGINYYLVENLRENLGIIASNFYGAPEKKLKIVGITGTNGKTTITYMLESIIGEDKVARIGTVEYKVGKEIIPAPNTTPESIDIIKICKKAVEAGLEYLVMEVSSHALKIGRVKMLDFDCAVFTNLTPEHLDFHHNMEEYYSAKEILFKKLKKDGKAVINIDDIYGERLYKTYGGLSYSLEKNADLTQKDLEGKKLRVLGKYNLYNLLGAMGAGKVLGIDHDKIIDTIEHVHTAPGRFEPVKGDQDFLVVVDYAHTGDALENILKSINEIKKGRVITVFGCGGDRDNSKRPVMAKIAEKYSDIVVATSDNPRTEDPEKILSEVVNGFEKNNHIVEIDRKKAIFKAIELAKKDDTVLIAGKGHENYQILGRTKIHFDDREVAREAILKKKGGK